jgi:hypothetical protein
MHKLKSGHFKFLKSEAEKIAVSSQSGHSAGIPGEK